MYDTPKTTCPYEDKLVKYNLLEQAAEETLHGLYAEENRLSDIQNDAAIKLSTIRNRIEKAQAALGNLRQTEGATEGAAPTIGNSLRRAY